MLRFAQSRETIQVSREKCGRGRNIFVFVVPFGLVVCTLGTIC